MPLFVVYVECSNYSRVATTVKYPKYESQMLKAYACVVLPRYQYTPSLVIKLEILNTEIYAGIMFLVTNSFKILSISTNKFFHFL